MKYKRIFLIVIDSLGVGQLPDHLLYGDNNVDTLGNIGKTNDKFYIPTLQSLGLSNLHYIKSVHRSNHPQGYYFKAKEYSKGKDTITGHYEMMGLYTNKPFTTYSQDGFPKELMNKIEKKTGYKFIGNKAASGTEIINELGMEHIKNNTPIIYTSADSVLQVAAHEKYFGLSKLYKLCEIIRELTKDEYKIGRIIARPFIGEDGAFKRTSNRKDYALNPFEKTLLDTLQEDGLETIGIGKIGDIFNECGLSKIIHSSSSLEGMDQTIQEATSNNFTGLCFTNLVDFDSLWGHRRDSVGYKCELESFDSKLDQLIKALNNSDLLILCADHGNDSTYIGSDHTREYIPVICYNNQFEGYGLLPVANDFCVIAQTIADNFGLSIKNGKSILKYLI